MSLSMDLIENLKQTHDHWELELAAASDDAKRSEMLSVLVARKAESIKKAEAVFDLFVSHGFGLELVNKSCDRWAFILNDPSEPGRYRYQEFDKNGFLGHMSYDTVEQTLMEASSAGYNQHDPGALTRLSETRMWADGMAVNSVVQAMNSQMISFEEGRKRLDALAEERRIRDEMDVSNVDSEVIEATRSGALEQKIQEIQTSLNGLFDAYCQDHMPNQEKDRIEARIIGAANEIDACSRLMDICRVHETISIDESFSSGSGEMRARVIQESDGIHNVQYFNPAGVQWTVMTPSYDDAAAALNTGGFFFHDPAAFNRYAESFEERKSAFLKDLSGQIDEGSANAREVLEKVDGFDRNNPGFGNHPQSFVIGEIPASVSLREKISKIETTIDGITAGGAVSGPAM